MRRFFGGGFCGDSLHAPAMADFEAVVGEHRAEAEAEPLPGVADENREFGFAVIGVGDSSFRTKAIDLVYWP